MKRKRTIILKHFFIWIILCVAWAFSVEPLLRAVLSGVYDVEQWIATELAGILLITIAIISSLIIFLFRRKRKLKTAGKLA
jgi:hypothetical protein